jgi:hypothetical protein
VVIDGWTTDATRYIRIYVNSTDMHVGLWDATKYNINTSASHSYAIDNRENYVRIEGLQLTTSTLSGVFASRVTASSSLSDIRVDRCVLKLGTTITISTGKNTFTNCVAHEQTNSGFLVSGGTTLLECFNVTVCATGGYGWSRSSGTVNITNCYSGGCALGAYSGTVTKTTCAHSQATTFTGSTENIDHSTNNFVNVTAGSRDYHLVSGASSTLLTGGTDLSGTFTVDIDGETRSDWSIGADEYLAPAAVPGLDLIINYSIEPVTAIWAYDDLF